MADDGIHEKLLAVLQRALDEVLRDWPASEPRAPLVAWLNDNASKLASSGNAEPDGPPAMPGTRAFDKQESERLEAEAQQAAHQQLADRKEAGGKLGLFEHD